MALNKTVLKTSIESLLEDLAERTEDPAQARADFAEQLADAMEAFVKSAEIVYESGLTAPNGAVEGVFVGNLK